KTEAMEDKDRKNAEETTDRNTASIMMIITTEEGTIRKTSTEIKAVVISTTIIPTNATAKKIKPEITTETAGADLLLVSRENAQKTADSRNTADTIRAVPAVIQTNATAKNPSL